MSGTWWAPKPLRPDAENPLFKMDEPTTIVKGLTPMQQQRHSDGTPHTKTGVTGLRPADPVLTLRPDLVKGSMVERYAVRPQQPKQEPQDPVGVVKAFLEAPERPGPPGIKTEVIKSQEMVAKMQASIGVVLQKSGAEKPSEDAEDEEKSAAQGAISLAAMPVKTALATGMRR